MESLSPELFHNLITYLDPLDLIRASWVNHEWFIIAYIEFLIQKKQGKQIITSPVHLYALPRIPKSINITYVRYPYPYCIQYEEFQKRYDNHLYPFPNLSRHPSLDLLECDPLTIHYVSNHFLSKLVLFVEDHFNGDALWKLWQTFNFGDTFRNMRQMGVVFTSEKLARLYWPKPKRELLPRKLESIIIYVEGEIDHSKCVQLGKLEIN